MEFSKLLGILAGISLLLPISVIIFSPLAKNKMLVALVSYYFIMLFFNLCEDEIIKLPYPLIEYIDYFFSILALQLHLFFLLYFKNSKTIARKIFSIIFIEIVLAIVVTYLFNISEKAYTFIYGVAIIAILVFSILFFSEQTRAIIWRKKSSGKAIMLASIIFAFGTYFVLFITYYVVGINLKSPTNIIYYIAIMISAISMFIGLLFERKRYILLNEIKTTRKELSMIYSRG